jgi:hypothetical protein
MTRELKLMFDKEQISSRKNKLPVVEKEMIRSLKTMDFKAGKPPAPTIFIKYFCKQKL